MKQPVAVCTILVVACTALMVSNCRNHVLRTQANEKEAGVPVNRVAENEKPVAPGGPPVVTASSQSKSQPARLMLESGPTQAELEGPFEVAATATYKRRGHLYVRVIPPPRGAGFNRFMDNHRLEVVVPGRHGVAVIERRVRQPRSAAGNPEVGMLVRLVGSAVPKTLTLKCHVLKQRWGRAEGGKTFLINVTGMSKAATEATLESRFYEELGASLKWNREGALFMGFASQRLQLLAGKRTQSNANRPRRNRRIALGDMMSLYTGASSIEEALQADRGLLIRNQKREKRTIELSTIKGVPLSVHPWKEMISALKAPPVMEPLAAAVPFDMAYLHFPDLRTAVKMGNDLDQWLAPLLQLTEWRSGSSHMVARYEEELMIERMGLAEKLGHLAAKSVAVALGDPFLRDGADISIIFHLNQELLLSTALALYESRAKSRHADLKVTEYDLAGHRVRWARTADRRVNQHRVKLGERLILSNSKAAIERFVGVFKGTVKALNSTGDFRYMRARYPYSAKEAAYLFIGDAFVARAVSPRTKILQTRRMAAQADLYAVGFGALLHGWLEGRAPTNIKQVVKAGTLKRSELKHADGSRIRFTPNRGASSKRWGRVAAMTPLAELSIDKVTKSEAQAYAAFQTSYQRYWKGYIDPIAMRVNRSADGKELSVDGLMLPLIANSAYDELINIVGKARVKSRRWGPGFVWTVALGQGTRLRRKLNRLPKKMSTRNIGAGWVGDWVMFGTADNMSLWNMLVSVGAIPELSTVKREKSITALANTPFFVAAHIKNRLSLAASLTGLRLMAEETAPGLLTWGKSQPHRSVPVVTVSAREKGGLFGRIDLTFHYAIASDVLLLSLDYGTMTGLIDAVLDGKGPGTPEDPNVSSQTEWRLSMGGPNDGLALSAMGLLEHPARVQSQRAQRDLTVLYRGLGALPHGSELRQTALGYLGFEPSSVHGGEFTVADGWVTHSLYGNPLVPRALAIPVKESPATRLIQGLKMLEMTLGFHGEKESRGLRVNIGWDRR